LTEKILPPSVTVHVFGKTDVGRAREHNEDSFVVADLTTDNATLQPEVRTHTTGAKGTLFMVADGMGGAAAGEIASEMATTVILDELRTRWMSTDDNRPVTFARALKEATKVANERINQFALSHLEYRGMGTTATIAGLLGDTLYLAQIGDSRAYLVRDGTAVQITKDQSLMQKLVEAGEMTEEEAEHSDRRNIILQALGPETTVKVDLTQQQLRRGDTLVLCSDGLSTQISKEQIAGVVSAEPDLMAACKKLIDKANEAGGPDNITVILARFEGDGLTSVQAGDSVGHRTFTLPSDHGLTPPMSIDRIMSGDTPTQPVPIVPSPDSQRKTKPVNTPVQSAAAPTPAGRRPPSRGRFWLFLLAAVGFFVAAGILLRRG
jgi:serine/threonine protein phosphatase PrpC